MKRILFLLLLTVSVYGQNPSRFAKIQITGNTNSGTATKVNVQEANGEVNTQTINTGFNKNIGLGGSDVVGATTLLNQYSTTPVDWTATAFNSGQVVFYAGKQWVAKIATVAGDVPSVSSKWEEITFEALSNKTTTVDQTIIDGSTNAVSGNAVFDGLALKSNIGHTHVASQITDLSKASVGLGNVDNTSDLSKPLSTATINALATKAPISSVHNPVTIGTANGLSLSTQQLSLGLASSGTTGALSGTDWNTFNDKQDAFGFTPENVVNKQNSLAVDGTGAKYATVDAVNTELVKKQNIVPASRGLISGDSTVGYNGVGQDPISDYLVTDSDTAIGCTVNSIAVSGHTIEQQKTAWLAVSDKASYDYIIVQIGINNLSESTSTIIGKLQDYIDTINLTRKDSSILIIGTMLEVKGALLGDLSYFTRLQEVNSSIMGEGASPITGVDVRANNHTIALTDSGFLGTVYDVGDHVHENNLARNIIAQSYRQVLQENGILQGKNYSIITPLKKEQILSSGIMYGTNQIGAFKDLSGGVGDPDRQLINLRYDDVNNIGSIGVGSFGTNSKKTPIEIQATDDSGKLVYVYLDGSSNYINGSLEIKGNLKGIVFNPGVAEFSAGITHKIGGVNHWILSEGAGDGSTNYNLYNYGGGGDLGKAGIAFSVDKITNSIYLSNTPTAPTAPAGTNTNQIATTAFVKAAARPYKVYTALLTQIGNAAPTATVLENTLGGTVVWSRTGTGVYTATLNGAFPLGKTTVMPFFGTINGGVNLSQTISGVRIDNNSVGIRTSAGSTLTDVLLLDATIEIRIYN